MTRPPFTLDRDAGLVVDRRALVASGVMDRQLRAAKTLYKRNQEQQMTPDQMIARLDAAERENELLLNKLNFLLMLISKKYPGETRYETACRYIREAENQEVSGPKIDATMAAEKGKG